MAGGGSIGKLVWRFFVTYLKDIAIVLLVRILRIKLRHRAPCRFNTSTGRRTIQLKLERAELTGASGQPECQWNARGRMETFRTLGRPMAPRPG